jgi:tRNA pseudouridine38-40 synthase
MEEIQEKDVPPVRLAFRTGYLGDRFFGSQLQDHRRTVEGEFIAACERSDLFSDFREARFLASGRTDRGVHSRGQVYAFTTNVPQRAVSVLNWVLPKDIWVTGYAEVDEGFNPRYRAENRTYRYYFGEKDLDVPAMQEACAHFIGRHDFSRFARVGDKDPFRKVLSAGIFNEEGLTCFEVTAQSFLWHMVRYMAGALLQVGIGRWTSRDIESRLLDRAMIRPLSPAPPAHLVFWDVDCGISFSKIPAVGRTEDFIRGLRGDHAIMTRICSVFEQDLRSSDHFFPKR